MPVFPYCGKSPQIHETAMVSPLATIIGDVEISKGTAVFPGAVIRGDVAKITIGQFSNIQDNAVLHGAEVYAGDNLIGHLPVEIGDYVTIAHGAVVQGSKIASISMIGINAIVYNGAVVGEGSIVGMNATILEHRQIPPRSIVVGVPGKVIKKVDDVTYSKIRNHALHYHELAKSHKGIIF